MANNANMFAETTDLSKIHDAFSDAMRSLRISGSILLSEDYAPPWSIAIPDAERLRTLLKLALGVRAVDFHFVQRGHIVVTSEDKTQVIVEAGEMAICFGGTQHRISQGDRPKSVSVETVLADGKNVFEPAPAERARCASLICGVFLMHDVELNPLFAALPSVMHVSPSRPMGYNIAGLLERIATEVRDQSLGGVYVVERLLELLCVETLRSHINSASALRRGWFKGLNDPVVGRAISMIHAKPGMDWSVKRLASSVAMSPSRFAARFSTAVGDSPMAYVSKWRMNVAGRMLSESHESVARIAVGIGYESVPAFNRAFKKLLGVSPTAWRSGRGDDMKG